MSRARRGGARPTGCCTRPQGARSRSASPASVPEASLAPTPSGLATSRDASSVLEAAIQRLPPDYRIAVQLYDIEGRPIAEVAAAMSRSIGAVHMIRARAHDRLRHELGSASQFFSGSE